MVIDSIDDDLSYGSVRFSDYESTGSCGSRWEGREVSQIRTDNKWSEDSVGFYMPTYTPPPYKINYHPMPPSLQIPPPPKAIYLPPPNIHHNIPKPPVVVQPPPFKPTPTPTPSVVTHLQPTPIKIPPAIINPPPMPSFETLPSFASSSPKPIETPSIRAPEISASATPQIPHSQNPIFATTTFQPSPLTTAPFVHDILKTPLNQALAASSHSNPAPIGAPTAIKMPAPSEVRAAVNVPNLLTTTSHPAEAVTTSANALAPTLHTPKPQEPIPLKDKALDFFSTLGGGLKRKISETAHDVWGYVSPFSEDAARMQSEVSNKTHDNVPVKEHQWGEVTKGGHAKIDEIFDTDLAYRHDPNYVPSIPVIQIGLPPPPTTVNSLIGRIGQLIGFGSAEANAARTGSIASEVIKDITAVERAGVVGQELNAVKNVSVLENNGISAAQVAETRLSRATISNAIVKDPSTLIRIQPDGIWQIEGKNITSFNPESVLNRNSKSTHLFDPKHNLHKIGSPEKVVDVITKEIVKLDSAGIITTKGPFEVSINIENYSVIVRGNVINGELKYGTFFIPD